MELANKDLILKDIPLFSGLLESAESLISEKVLFREYKKGDIIYQEGSAPDAFYCVISGRVVIYTLSPDGNDKILEYLHRGKYFGIISLLTGDPHSVTSRAVNDSLLLIINKDDFNFILKNIPQLAIDLSQTLSRRLKNKDLHPKTIFESTIISVFSPYPMAGKSIYALNLALSLKKETRKSAAILEILPEDKTPSFPARLEVSGDWQAMGQETSLPVKDLILKNKFGLDLLMFNFKPQDFSGIEKLIKILSIMVNDYHFIILDLPPVTDEFVLRALNQSDSIHLLTGPDPVDLKTADNLIEKLKTDFQFQESKIKVIISEYGLAKLPLLKQQDLLNSNIFATLPRIEAEGSQRLVLDMPDCEYSKAVKRISRKVGDCLVGLALGVGVGYGFCHIGVLKVFEEEKIPLDVICGASIGALIASLWATGRSAEEILEISKEFKESKFVWRLVDLAFPTWGFIKGNRLYEFLKKYLGNKTFYDVKLPLKIIASDIRRKESRVLDKGLLADAIMASCSMPGVFRPFKLKEEVLFDGGIINPLPTEALFEMGVAKIIAVNVTPSREDVLRHYEDIKEQLAGARQAIKRRKWFNLRGYFRERLKNNIVDVIFSSIEVMQSELVQREEKLADVVLHPDTRGLHWMELHRAEEFAKRGEDETRKNLAKIRQIIYD